MDPNLFHIDWERTLEAVVGVIILSFFVERVAAVVFESRWFSHNTKIPDPGSEEHQREQRDAAIARAIIAADGDDEAVRAAADAVGPANPLWPPDPEHPQRMVERARRALDTMRRRHLRRQRLTRAPIKEAGAVALAVSVCVALEFDALSFIILSERTTVWGAVFTGVVVAGGSKASIKLFQDLLGVRSSAVRELRAPREEPA